MRRQAIFFAAFALWLVIQQSDLLAGGLGWGSFAGLLHRSPVDIAPPNSEDQCDHEGCIVRTPVRECVKGKKKVYDCKVRYEYVAIPETKYRWKTKLVTKKIPCPYCMPTCETQDGEHCFESERWDTHETCGCGKLHCKRCQCNLEKLPCKHCGRTPGETEVKVHYWTCVREPYTVYRQVKRPVCVKQPRYEHVEVPITRYVCRTCGETCCSPRADGGCEHCCE